ncbi:restriction endonuclease subunit S [Bradyrhizobium iriomotense]|uniref:restriction endonuclease subunit S n=1 Tax=Bradyrhizobium iriomotense TaxID=441950 RepID=UPI001B8A3650|nr:restriction endonuclease subunit S [Bradyrhizobium iriomotense]
MPVVNQKCIRWHRLEQKHFKFTARDAFDRLAPELRIRAGDLLWNSTGTGTIGRATVYDGTVPELTVDSHVTIVRPRSIDPSYLGYFIETSRVQHLVVDGHVGSTNQQELPRTFVENLFIPLAPPAEQRRIVGQLDALFAEIAEGEVALAEARKGLEIFRRALLKAAVTGELTKDWRAANSISETGHDVLARLAAKSTGKLSTSRRKTDGAVSLADIATLPALPDGWAWTTLAQIGEIVGGATVDKKRKPLTPVTIPYLRVANVQRGYIDLSEVKSITVEQATLEKLRLVRGDLLLNEGGDRDKIGRGWVWDDAIPDMIHQNHVFRVRLRSSSLNPFFVSHYANEMGRKFFITEGKQTTNLASISLSKISLLPVPVPPPAEAAEILRRVSDALAASADTLALLDAEAADAARLKQSILKAAFEGRLVPQDPADEPASALLSRVSDAPVSARTARGRVKTRASAGS